MPFLDSIRLDALLSFRPGSDPIALTRILRKHGYRPEKQKRATQTVLERAALVSADLAVV